MAKYVDGFVIPIKKKNLKAYKKMAKVACEIWMDLGALDYQECIYKGYDPMCSSPFSKITKLQKGETVVFAYIVYKSKADRDRVNKKVMKDPRMKQFENQPMPFDMKRFTAGFFEVIVGS